MPSATFSIPLASAVVGADIFTVGSGLGVKQAQNGNGVPRKLQKIGVTGSAAAGDFGFDLYAGGHYLGSYMNTTLGVVVPLEARDLVAIPSEDIIGANVSLIGIINDAAATNPVIVTILWEDRPVMGGAFRSDKMVVAGGGGGGYRRSYSGYGAGYRGVGGARRTGRRSARRRFNS